LGRKGAWRFSGRGKKKVKGGGDLCQQKEGRSSYSCNFRLADRGEGKSLGGKRFSIFSREEGVFRGKAEAAADRRRGGNVLRDTGKDVDATLEKEGGGSQGRES